MKICDTIHFTLPSLILGAASRVTPHYLIHSSNRRSGGGKLPGAPHGGRGGGGGRHHQSSYPYPSINHPIRSRTGAGKTYISAALTAALVTIVLVGFFESKQHGTVLTAPQQQPLSTAENGESMHISNEVPRSLSHVGGVTHITGEVSPKRELIEEIDPSSSSSLSPATALAKPPKLRHGTAPQGRNPSSWPFSSHERPATPSTAPSSKRRRWNNSLVTFGEYLRQRNSKNNESNSIDAAVAAGNEAWHKMLVARNRLKQTPEEHRQQQQQTPQSDSAISEGPCPLSEEHHGGHFPSSDLDVVVTWVNGSDPIHQFKKITDRLLLRSSTTDTTSSSKTVISTFVCDCLRLEETQQRRHDKTSRSSQPRAFIGGVGSVKRISGIYGDKQNCLIMLKQATLGNLLHIAPDIRVAFPGLNSKDLRLGSKKKQQQSAVSGRDRDSGELKILLRSMDANMAWHVGDTFIVAPGQVPTWVDRAVAFLSTSPRGARHETTINKGLRFVHQDALITGKPATRLSSTLPEKVAAKSLPTFNTNVLEYFLYKINNRRKNWNRREVKSDSGVLSDEDDAFIHMNDDYMILSPTTLSTFFTQDGGAKLFFEQGVISNTTMSVWEDVKARQEQQLLLNHGSRKCIEQRALGEQQTIVNHFQQTNNSGGGDQVLLRKSWVTAVEHTDNIIQTVLQQGGFRKAIASVSRISGGDQFKNHFLKHAPFVSSRRHYDTLLRHCPSISPQILRTFPIHKHRSAFSVIAPQLHHSLLPYLHDLEHICASGKNKDCVDCDNDELGTVAPLRKQRQINSPLPLPIRQIGAESSAVLLVFTESIASNDAKIFAVLNQTSSSPSSSSSRCSGPNQPQHQLLPTFLTINDGLGSSSGGHEVEELQEQVRYYQEALFPDPSPYEQQKHKQKIAITQNREVKDSSLPQSADRHLDGSGAYCRFMCHIPWHITVPHFWVNYIEEWSGSFTPRSTSPVCPLLRSITSQYRHNNQCGCNKPNISFHIHQQADDAHMEEEVFGGQEQPFWFIGCSAVELKGIPVSLGAFHLKDTDAETDIVPLQPEQLGRIGLVSINLSSLGNSSIPSGTKAATREFLVVGEVFHIGSFGLMDAIETSQSDHSNDGSMAVMLPGTTHMIHQDSAVDLYRSFPVPYTDE